MTWRVTGASVRGAAHERSKQPNQDAWRAWSSSNGRQIVVAVADGHGSAPSFRSHVGARLAVAMAIREGSSFLQAQSYNGRTDEQWRDLNLALDSLAKQIVFRWVEEVRKRWRRRPPTAKELQAYGGHTMAWPPAAYSQDEDGLASVGALAYGTTLLVVLATESFLGFLQLGDGDILTVSADGTVDRAIERDQRFLGNQTASLAMKDAAKQFKSRCWPYRRQLPALVLLATDGYANSYHDEDAFRNVAAEYFRQLRDHGVEAVADRLPTWLREVTLGGSGDDVTVGLLVRAADVDRHPPADCPARASAHHADTSES